MKIEIRKLKKSDKKDSFCSDNIEIDRFFIRFAGQNQFRHSIGTTYVANDVETQNILGYITISTGSLNV